MTNENITNKHTVFVYGSLKRGFGNYKKFLSKSVFLGTTSTKKTNFVMFSFGSFPAVLEFESKDELGSIEGEVFEIDDETLFGLDVLESNGLFYTRKETELDNGLTAWMYILNGPSRHMSLPKDDPQIRLKLSDDQKLIFSWFEID